MLTDYKLSIHRSGFVLCNANQSSLNHFYPLISTSVVCIKCGHASKADIACKRGQQGRISMQVRLCTP
jgi:hypothetical protein